MKNGIFLFSLLSLLICGSIFSCGTRQQQSQATDAPFVEFMQFHKKFLEDSTFQMERVLFPLEGLPSNADSAIVAAGNFRWQPDNWELHRPFNFEESEYEQQFIPFDDNLIIENIVHRTGGYVSERRFAKIEGQWYLIYYSGLNPVQ